MIIHKSQIRPRSKKITLTNAEVLALPSATEGILGVGKILIPGIVGCSLLPRRAVLNFINLADVTGIDASSDMGICTEDFAMELSFLFENAASIPVASNLSDLLAAGNSAMCPVEPLQNVSGLGSPLTSDFTIPVPINYTDLSGNSGLGIMIVVDNTLDFTGGDPGNKLEIYLEYEIINISV